MKKRFLRKKLWKTILLLFGIPLIAWNCEDYAAESIQDNTTLKTLTKQEVVELLSYKNKQNSIQKNSNSYIKFDINKLTYEDISNTDAKLAVIPGQTKNKAAFSRVLMLNVQGENKTVVFNMFPSTKNHKTDLFDGEITIATLQGQILRAFRVQEGKINSFYSSNSYASKNFDANYSSKDSENAECRQWCGHQASDAYCICNMQYLDEVLISGSTSIEYIPISDLYGSDAVNYSGCEVDCNNTWNSVHGGSSVNFEECPLGKVKDAVNNCVCPEGYTEDNNGNCVEKPCEGDPVANPSIAPQTNSGIQGGLHDTCARKDKSYTCKGIKGRKTHNGVDILNPYGSPVFAIRGGTATVHEQRNEDGELMGAGYYVVVVSNFNGQTIRNIYFHLQSNNRVTGIVEAGEIIGYQGDSGNLANAISQGYVDSHVHVKTQINGEKANPLDQFNTTIDPESGQVTTPCK